MPVPNSVVADQILQLRLTTNRLRDAHKGRAVSGWGGPMATGGEGLFMLLLCAVVVVQEHVFEQNLKFQLNDVV